MAEDAFYRQDWAKAADKRLGELPEDDRKVVERLFRKKKEQGNDDRDLEKTARDISLFRRKFLPEKSLSKTSIAELKTVFGKLFESDASYYTICDFRKHLRQFYRELQGDQYNPLHYDFMRGANPKTMKGKKRSLRNLKQVLGQDEIEALVKACKSWRDKAYIMVSFDVMARVGTLARVKIKDVFYKGKDIWLRFDTTKEGGAFEVGLTFSRPFIAKWMAMHPDPRTEQYLFCAAFRPPSPHSGRGKGSKPTPKQKTQYGLWDYSTISKMLRKAATDSNLKTKIHSHIFRGSGATFWKQMGSPDQEIEQRGDWTPGSESLRGSYIVFEKEASHESAKARLRGEKPKQATTKLAPTTCAMCQWENEPGQEFCFNCHHQLSIKEVAKEASRVSEMQQQLADALKRIDGLEKKRYDRVAPRIKKK